MTGLLTLDPGETTGWAFSVYGPNTALEFEAGGQIEGGLDGAIAFLLEWATPFVPEGLDVVYESFHIRPSVKSPNVTPLRIEGAIAALFRGSKLIHQPPAMKSMVPDDELRKLGLWIPGQRHHMDARIHTLAHMKSIAHLPTLEKYYGSFAD